MRHAFVYHVTHIHESCHTCIWVMSHLKNTKGEGVMSHVTHLNQSRQTTWVASRMFMSYALSREYAQYIVALFRETACNIKRPSLIMSYHFSINICNMYTHMYKWIESHPHTHIHTQVESYTSQLSKRAEDLFRGIRIKQVWVCVRALVFVRGYIYACMQMGHMFACVHMGYTRACMFRGICIKQVWVCVRALIFVQGYIWACMHMGYIFACVHMGHTCACMHMCLSVCMCLFGDIYVCICMCVHIFLWRYICACMHVMCTDIYVCGCLCACM